MTTNRLSLRSALFSMLILMLLLLQVGCASSRVLRVPLDPNSQKFLDIVRYIITPAEEKIFREMPAEDRAEFVVDFWKRRDPTPETAANEFRTQYYARVAQADKAFRAGIPGWLTDRGRIYILLGPPTDVIRKSMGESTVELSKRNRDLSSDLLEEGTRTERPTEIWIYNQYPDYFSGPLRLVFVDYESNGDYKLTTDVEVKPFSMMTYRASDPNLVKFQWLGEVVDGSSPRILPFLDFEKTLGKIEKDKQENFLVECGFRISLAVLGYRPVNGQYSYDLELSVEALSTDLGSSYRESKEIRGALSADEIRASVNQGKAIIESIFIPLERGTNKIYFSVRDRVDGKRLRKLEVLQVR